MAIHHFSGCAKLMDNTKLQVKFSQPLWKQAITVKKREHELYRKSKTKETFDKKKQNKKTKQNKKQIQLD